MSISLIYVSKSLEWKKNCKSFMLQLQKWIKRLVMANEDVHPVHEEIADDNADEHAVEQEAQEASMYKLVAQKIVK